MEIHRINNKVNKVADLPLDELKSNKPLRKENRKKLSIYQ